MDIRRKDYMQKLRDEKFEALRIEKMLAAKETWQELKEEGDILIEEYVDAYEARKFEEAYNDYVESLDEYNQSSVGRIEFELEDIEGLEDLMEEDEDLDVMSHVTRYVASATAKALMDLECPIYENGLMNIVSLTGEKPIKTVKDAHLGSYTDLEFVDARYFSKDVRVRVWDLSACGLESFFASQGGINVYISIDDDEVELDVSIDTTVMMDLEALIFLMRMKEYLKND